jgi:hypothetical protein
MFSLPGAVSFAVSPADVAATYFGSTRSVAELYGAISHGSISVTGDVLGPFAIQGDTQFCNVADWSAGAREAAVSTGADLSGYTHFAYLFPRVDSCPWAGMADIHGNASYINAPAAGDVGLYHAAHELGHNFGAGHANALNCVHAGQPVAMAANSECSVVPYGDALSLMGSGIVRAPSAWERLKMGMLGANAVSDLDATAVGAFDLAALDGAADGPRLLKVARPGGGYLLIEYRRAGEAFDSLASTGTSAALLLHVIADDASEDSAVVDATPGTSSTRDAGLAPGATFDDSPDGLTIKFLSAGADYASIQIGPTGAAIDPVPPSPLPDPASDNTRPAAVSGLNVRRVGPHSVIASWTPVTDSSGVVSYQVWIDSRRMRHPVVPRIRIRHLGAGTHQIRIQAVNGLGNAGPEREIQFAI